MTAHDAEIREHVLRWLREERDFYANQKYVDETTQREALIADTRDFPHLDNPEEGITWETFIMNYLGRVKMFGVDTPNGRQALGKLIVTGLHCLETAVLVHGLMPEPGHSSGEIRPWASGAISLTTDE